MDVLLIGWLYPLFHQGLWLFKPGFVTNDYCIKLDGLTTDFCQLIMVQKPGFPIVNKGLP